MSTKRYQGEIVRWKDARGFGFIRTEAITDDIFLHINAIKNCQRRPRVGDTIYFDLQQKEQGKLKAVNASLKQQRNYHQAQQRVTTQSQPPAGSLGRIYQSQSTASKPINRESKRTFKPSFAKKISSTLLMGAIVAGVVISLPKLFDSRLEDSNAPDSGTASKFSNPFRKDCDIKGNISYSSGEKLYHLPSDRDYAEVIISKEDGERWFCSETEAINAGWQHAATKYAN